ncbi:hypothetical protein DW954_06730 [Clostridium sp. AM45-5]|nr:hypothetical protein DW954_06730 [Clostridium sp. AM45-5]
MCCCCTDLLQGQKLSFWSLADTLIPSFVLGQAIGRWGN